MRRQKWLATFGSRARAMRPGLFLPEATPVKHSPAGTLTLVPATRHEIDQRQRGENHHGRETSTKHGLRLRGAIVFLRLYRPRSTGVSHRAVRSFNSIR